MSDSAARPNADEEWDNLLQQLPRQSQGQPRPYFYNRVQARLHAEARPWLPSWVRRPAYALLLGALVLALSGDDAALASGRAPAAASVPVPR